MKDDNLRRIPIEIVREEEFVRFILKKTYSVFLEIELPSGIHALLKACFCGEILQYWPFCIPVWAVSHCNIGHIALQYRPYRDAIKAVLRCDKALLVD